MTDSSTDSMEPTDTLHSQLSAFMDDELPEAQSDLFIRRLVRDADMQHTMNRYQLMGEALRHPLRERTLSRDFSARVAAALEQDTVAASRPQFWQRAKAVAGRWGRPAAGAAVAASVAMVTLLVVKQQSALQPADSAQVASHDDQSPSYVVPATSSINSPVAPIPTARLTNYVLAHSEFSSPLGRRNVMTGLLSEDAQVEVDMATQAATSSTSSVH